MTRVRAFFASRSSSSRRPHPGASAWPCSLRVLVWNLVVLSRTPALRRVKGVGCHRNECGTYSPYNGDHDPASSLYGQPNRYDKQE